jgi:hypothetical protein
VDAYTFFGIQIALTNFRQDRVRSKLHALIAANTNAQVLVEKRAFWKKICATINEALPAFELGYWDLVRGDKAEKEFESWSSEIEGALATEQEELGKAADEMNRFSAERQYVLVTLMFLVGEGTNADLTLGERCDIPEKDWQTRQTYARLVATPPLLNFANVRADAVYLLPGNDEDGLSEFDLADEAYKHLKPLL